MKKLRTPQEKKCLSYVRDRRNMYGKHGKDMPKSMQASPLVNEAKRRLRK